MKRSAIYLGTGLILFHMLLSPVLAANLLVIDHSDRWELGLSVSGSSVSRHETSLIHLTESHHSMARRDIVAQVSFRPTPGRKWTLSGHHSSHFEEVDVFRLSDPIEVTREQFVDVSWRSVDLGFEQKWNLPMQRSLQLHVGFNLCTFEIPCRMTLNRTSLGYARIVDPVVVGFNLGLAKHETSTGTDAWTPMWSGAVEVVINSSLALGSFLSLSWASEGDVQQAVLGQKIAWRFSEQLLMTVGVHRELLSNEPNLSVAFQTRL